MCQMACVQWFLVHLLVLRSTCRNPSGRAGAFLAGFCGHCQARSRHYGPATIIAGGANVFSILRQGNSSICGFFDGFMQSYVLQSWWPGHSCGAGLDCVFISSSHAVVIAVHNGVGCCPIAPACCPILGSDHQPCASPATLPSLCHPNQMLGHLHLPSVIGSQHCSMRVRTCCSGAAESTSSAKELIPLLTMVPFLMISSKRRIRRQWQPS